jgi:hypothetical protein
LGESGLEENRRPPYTDHGFDDFTFDVGDWEPRPKQYFVSVDLPAPDLITYQPGPRAVENVVFEDGRRGTMPVDHILEYRVRDISKVQMHSPQLGKVLPLSCSDLHKLIQESRAPVRGDDVMVPPNQPGKAKPQLTRCSESNVFDFFFGIGLPGKDDLEHALQFYNGPLLRQFPKADQKKMRLRAIGVNPCPTIGGAFSMPAVVPAVQRIAEPLLLPVASIEDCRSGGLIGIAR